MKFCPRLHPNPRYAECCSECGSRELSTPQPRVSVWWKVLGFLLRVGFGIFLVVLSLEVVVALVQNQVVQNGILVLGLLLIALWAVWAMLPEWFRSLVHWLMKRKSSRERYGEERH